MIHDMNLLVDLFRANQLSLNMCKTVSMLFWPGKHKLDITIDSQHVPQVKQTRFLGVTLDEKLNWKAHISHVRDKLLVNKHLLQLGRNLLNKQSLLGIYYAHIYSHLTYSLNTWGSMLTKTQINNLFKIQKACVCIVHKNHLDQTVWKYIAVASS